MKILRSLYQAHLDGLSATDRRQAETLAVRRGERVRLPIRGLKSL
jgi:hypothetical protein